MCSRPVVFESVRPPGYAKYCGGRKWTLIEELRLRRWWKKTMFRQTVARRTGPRWSWMRWSGKDRELEEALTVTSA